MSAKFPATVGQWSTLAASSGPSTIYQNGDSTVIASFIASASYDGVVSNITQSRTETAAGACGSTDTPTNLTCYLRTGDGVINISADSGDTPLPTLVSFADELTTTLGTN